MFTHSKPIIGVIHVGALRGTPRGSKKKHSAHAITADVSLGQTAETVEFMGADCVIVTGSVTGEAPQVADVKEAKSHCRLPVFLGSGISEANIERFYNEADGFIIGSYFKVDGLWSNTIDPTRVTQLVNKLLIF